MQNNEEKKKNKKLPAFYIALCCCVLMIGVAGFITEKHTEDTHFSPDRETSRIVIESVA